MAKAIVVEPQPCCRPTVLVEGHNFKCPECSSAFCSQCFEPILEGNGDQVKCPKCKAVLDLP